MRQKILIIILIVVLLNAALTTALTADQEEELNVKYEKAVNISITYNNEFTFEKSAETLEAKLGKKLKDFTEAETANAWEEYYFDIRSVVFRRLRDEYLQPIVDTIENDIEATKDTGEKRTKEIKYGKLRDAAQNGLDKIESLTRKVTDFEFKDGEDGKKDGKKGILGKFKRPKLDLKKIGIAEKEPGRISKIWHEVTGGTGDIWDGIWSTDGKVDWKDDWSVLTKGENYRTFEFWKHSWLTRLVPIIILFIVITLLRNVLGFLGKTYGIARILLGWIPPIRHWLFKWPFIIAIGLVEAVWYRLFMNMQFKKDHNFWKRQEIYLRGIINNLITLNDRIEHDMYTAVDYEAEQQEKIQKAIRRRAEKEQRKKKRREGPEAESEEPPGEEES